MFDIAFCAKNGFTDINVMLYRVMKEDQKIASDLLKNGLYFECAKEFYYSKYVHPYAARAQFAILFIISIFAVLIAFTTFKKDYEMKQVPFAIYAMDQMLYYPIMKPLATEKENVELSVSRYLILRYIQLRESYDYKDFSEEDGVSVISSYIAALSSMRMAKEAKDYLDPATNPKSPILRYKNKISRKIEVLSFDPLSDNGGDTVATVKFKVNEIEIATGKVLLDEMYEAKIHYTINDLAKVVAKHEQLFFAITKYQTYKLSK